MFSTKLKSVMVVFTLIAVSMVFVGCNSSKPKSSMVNTGTMGHRADKYKQYQTKSYSPNSRVVHLGDKIETRDFYLPQVEPTFNTVSFD